jgi:hypothetical protein
LSVDICSSAESVPSFAGGTPFLLASLILRLHFYLFDTFIATQTSHGHRFSTANQLLNCYIWQPGFHTVTNATEDCEHNLFTFEAIRGLGMGSLA